ncbi:hypothetical protein EB001_08370, partial [bacterium]|nr:hypothetical protein [bacterium]
MEPNTNSSGMMNGLPQVPKENKKIGPILGALAIVLIIIIASLIFFGKKLNTNSSTNTVQTSTETSSGVTSQTGTESQGVEDSSAAINSDLDL